MRETLQQPCDISIPARSRRDAGFHRVWGVESARVINYQETIPETKRQKQMAFGNTNALQKLGGEPLLPRLWKYLIVRNAEVTLFWIADISNVISDISKYLEKS